MDFSNTIDAANAASITVNQMLHQTHTEIRQPDMPIHARQTDGDAYAEGLAVLFAVPFVGLIARLSTRA